MKVKLGFPLIGLTLLIALAITGAFTGLQFLMAVVFPYAAGAIFIAGLFWRVITWSRAPVAFHIPLVAGQQRSLPWIKSHSVESPDTNGGLMGRMALEILFFRSLFRNDRVELDRPQRLSFRGKRLLWLGSLAFHWSLLTILLRHLRFFIEPVPSFVVFLREIDGIFQQPWPLLYISDITIVLALGYLFARRVVFPQLRYISLASDYFAVLLIGSVAISGILMKTVFQVNLADVKELAMSLVRFHPVIPEGLNALFCVHIFLVSILLAYLPFSKMVHMAGILFSPTRNLKNNSRMRRHVNPLNRPVVVHTYEQYEDQFRPAMKNAGLPVDKE